MARRPGHPRRHPGGGPQRRGGRWHRVLARQEGGRPLLHRYGRYILIPPRQIRRAEQFFASHGRRAVFFGRFLAGIRFLVGPLPGIARMPFRRFFMYNASGAVVYVPVVTLVGYGAARHLHAVLGAVQRVGHFLLVVVVLLLTGLAWRAWQRAKH